MPTARAGVCEPRTTGVVPPPVTGLFQVKVIRLLAEQYCAVPRTRHSLPPRLNDAESMLMSSGSLVTSTVSVEGEAPLGPVTFSVKVRFCGVVLAGTTNVGLAVSALASVI